MQHMDGGVAILPTAPVRPRNRDVHYPYRPDSDFYYLTHFPEPEAVAVLVPGRAHGEYILFCRERNPEKEIWEGRRAGLEGRARSMAPTTRFRSRISTRFCRGCWRIATRYSTAWVAIPISIRIS